MKEYIYNGEKYYFTGRRWVDNRYLEVSLELISKLNSLLEKEIQTGNMDNESLLQFATNIKEGENYQLAIKALETLMERADIDMVKQILPRLVSCYRKVGMPEKAISVAERYMSIYKGQVSSAPLMTSVGAAFCDIEDYQEARKYANRARAKSGKEISPELKNLYVRINNIEGGFFRDEEEYINIYANEYIETEQYNMNTIECHKVEFNLSLEREVMNRIWKAIPIEKRKEYYHDFELICNSLKSGELHLSDK